MAIPRRGRLRVSSAPRAGDALLLVGRISPDDVERLCRRLQTCAERPPRGPILCDAGMLADPDLRTIDALARIQLSARRLGRELRLRNASSELAELLDLAGLRGVIRTA